MKSFTIAVRNYFFLTLLLGIIYPYAMTGLSKVFFADQAEGSLVRIGEQIVGSKLIAQKFESPKYFWSRPSATDYNPLPSGGSNAGPINADLVKATQERAQKLGQDAKNVPQQLLFASASGLDPHIDLKSALFQVPRVALSRGVPESEIKSTIEGLVESRQLGFLGEERINVLELNLALDNRK